MSLMLMSSKTVDVSYDREEKIMGERVRWVSKFDAARELEISLSTLDRKVGAGEIEVVREGRRVYVQMYGEYLSDDELLRRAIIRGDDLERTVRDFERTASELEEELAEARDAASVSEVAYRMLETAYTEERAAHRRTKKTVRTMGLVALALLVLLVFSVLMTWRPFT